MEENVVMEKGETSTAAIEVPEDTGNVIQDIDDELLESIFNELDGTVNRESIKLAMIEAKAKYQHARVKVFLPILMRRQIFKILKLRQIEAQKGEVKRAEQNVAKGIIHDGRRPI